MERISSQHAQNGIRDYSTHRWPRATIGDRLRTIIGEVGKETLMALNLKKRWADSKSLYEETVGKRKPSKDFISFIGRSSTGVESSLGNFDTAFEAFETTRSDALFTKLETSGDTAKQAMSKYAQVLAERTKKDKLTDPAYSKGLDMLKKELEAIASVIDEKVKTIKRDMKTVEKGLAAKSPDEVMSIAQKAALKNFKLNAGSVLKELAVGIAKGRAKPDPIVYRDALLPPLRDIGNSFASANLKKIGLDNLTQGSAYPRKAIDELAALEVATTKPATEQEVGKALGVIGPRATVVTAWFVNVARALV